MARAPSTVGSGAESGGNEILGTVASLGVAAELCARAGEAALSRSQEARAIAKESSNVGRKTILINSNPINSKPSKPHQLYPVPQIETNLSSRGAIPG